MVGFSPSYSSIGAKYPALGISITGYSHIFWTKKVLDYQGNGLNVYLYQQGPNPFIQVFRICRSATPMSEPQPPGIFIKGDTLHSVVVNYDLNPVKNEVVASRLYYNTWLWSNETGYQPLNSHQFYFPQDSIILPSILIDRNGRVVISYIAKDTIKLKYKDPSSNEWIPAEGPQAGGVKNYSLTERWDLFIAGNWEDSIRVYRGERRENGYNWQQEVITVPPNELPHWFLISPNPIIVGDYLISHGDGVNLERRGWIKCWRREWTFLGIRWMQKEPVIYFGSRAIPLYPQFCIRRRGQYSYLHIVSTLGDSSLSRPYHKPPYLIQCRTISFGQSIGEPIRNCDKVTFPNQGELLAIEPGTGNLHCVYNAGGSIVYAKSMDKGETWESVLEVDSGSYPSICLDNSGMSRITYLKNDTVFCKTLLTDNTWHKTVVFGYDGNRKPGPPAIVPTYRKELTDYSYCVFPVKNLTENNSNLCLSIFDVDEDMASEPEAIAEGDSLKSPSIAVTPGDFIHIVWEKDGEIYYRTSLGNDSTGEIIWSDIYNISESPDVISEDPVVEAYGELVIAAWKEGEPGEIYRRVRNISTDAIFWEPIENISQSPDRESRYPVLSTPDVVAYHEQIDSLNYEVFAWIKGEWLSHQLYLMPPGRL